VQAADRPEAPRFVSPDGRRAVRLYLLGMDPAAVWPGADKTLVEAIRKRGPSLEIEFSMMLGTNEVLVRPFTTRPGGQDTAHYRVLWEQGGREFLVLRDTPPKRMEGARTETPVWGTGEHILFFFDREKEFFPPAERYQPRDWDASSMKGPDKGSGLPLIAVDFRGAPGSERYGKTGELRRSNARPPARHRIQNFTTHSNTQNLKKTEQRPLFAMPAVQTNVASPDGRFAAQLAGGDRDPLLLLAEGDGFRDELWVLFHPLRLKGQASGATAPPAARLGWSRDSRYLLLLTRESGMRDVARLQSGEEVYLVFDTARWEGEVGPDLKQLEEIDFPKR
jgi:hypothetical protein